jgi:oligopeptide/dipeptide ABC transporter ATP-binding protein
VKAQIINLLEEIQANEGLSILFISHDLSVVHHISDSILVMYLGKVVEYAKTDELFRRPLHPYTRVLLEAIPVADPRRRRSRKLIRGEVMHSGDIGRGCRFYPRCRLRTQICLEREPELMEVEPGRWAACYHTDKE